MLKRALSVVVGGVVLAGVAGPAGPALAETAAYPTVDRPAALVVFPKIVFDSSKGIDTVVQLSNADGALANPCLPPNEKCGTTLVHCLYTWTGSGSRCEERDFWVELTRGQPIGWRVSTGLVSWNFQEGVPQPPDRQGEGFVLPVPTNPFTGELKCYVAKDQDSALPLPSNHLVGAATVYNYVADQRLDVSSYSAIGFRAVANETQFSDMALCLGGDPDSGTCPVAEYSNCSSQLMLDHRFDVAAKGPADNTSISNYLTLVPCSENFEWQVAPTRGLQLLVYNEFEQRFSLSSSMGCRKDTKLSDLTTAPVFSAAVQGTVVGQTRMRAVLGSGKDPAGMATGYGLLGIATEVRTDAAGTAGSAAHHLAMQGAASPPDVIYAVKDALTNPPPLPQP